MSWKINSNLPLPDHTKYRWDECFAKIIYYNIFCKNDEDYLLLLDKPDLQDIKNDTGIEVTAAVYQDDKSIERLYSLLTHNLAKNSERAKSEIEKLGGVMHPGFLLYPVRDNNPGIIIEAIKNKLSKLNGKEYKIFKNNFLFIFTSIYLDKEKYLEIINKIINLGENYKYIFNKIFVYRFGSGKLIEFSVTNISYHEYLINESDICIWSEKARKYAEDKELSKNDFIKTETS